MGRTDLLILTHHRESFSLSPPNHPKTHMVLKPHFDSMQSLSHSCGLFFAEIAELILTFMRRCKGSRIVKTILKEKNKVERLTCPDFKTYYKAAITKTVVLE